MLLNKEGATCFLTKDLLELAIATLCLSNFLLNSCSTSSLSSDTFNILTGIDANFMDFFHALRNATICGMMVLLGALGAGFLESARVAGSPLGIDGLLAGHRVGCGLGLGCGGPL